MLARFDRGMPLLLLGLLSAAAATALPQQPRDACTDKLTSLCGPERKQGASECQQCLYSKYKDIGFACYGKRQEEEGFCRVPEKPTCDSTLAAVCPGQAGKASACSACAGQHAQNLSLVHCTEASIGAWCTPGINPLYKTNITVYHVNPASYGLVPVNMNTGDAHGDMFFDIKSVATPLECAKNASVAGNAGFDCNNQEVVAPDLSITKLILEVDARYTHYSMCVSNSRLQPRLGLDTVPHMPYMCTLCCRTSASKGKIRSTAGARARWRPSPSMSAIPTAGGRTPVWALRMSPPSLRA